MATLIASESTHCNGSITTLPSEPFIGWLTDPCSLLSGQLDVLQNLKWQCCCQQLDSIIDDPQKENAAPTEAASCSFARSPILVQHQKKKREKREELFNNRVET